MPKLAALQDFFGAPALGPTWSASTSAPDVSLDQVLDRVQIACTTSYPQLGAAGPWDATSSAVYARVVPPPVGNGGTQLLMRLSLDASNRATLIYSGGSLSAAVLNAGVTTAVSVGTYNPFLHAWWRIREQAGNFLFDTSPDGWSWTPGATIPHSWPAGAVQAVWLCGYSGTEAAGMYAYVDQVGTTVTAPAEINLNFPRIEDGWGPLWDSNGGTVPLDRYVDISERVRNGVTVGRGRQYETDQVRAAEVQLELANDDGRLEPTNTAGPWYGSINPYQPYRRRAQWPPSRNLLDQVMATGGDLGGFSGVIVTAATGIFSSTDTAATFVTTASAWQGSTVMQFAVPASAPAQSRICYAPRPPVVPGRTYTVSLRVRNITPSSSLSVAAALGWYTTAGGLTPSTTSYGTTAVLAGSASAGWTTLVVTATAPAGAAGFFSGVATAATAAAACAVQVDGWQLEAGAQATTWQVPGIWYPVYAGWTERWPAQWGQDGTYGRVSPSAVDSLALLSQQTLADPLTQEINSLSPRFVYKFDDPSGSSSVADWTGNYPAASITAGKYGPGVVTLGTEITATDTVNGIYTGSTGTVANFNNGSPGVALTAPASFVKLSSAGIMGPADPSQWSRLMAFRYTGPTPTSGAFLWSSMDGQRSGGNPSGAHIYLYLDSNGVPRLWIQGPSGASNVVPFGGSANCVDGNWHLLWFGYNQNTQQMFASLDGATASYFGGIAVNRTPTGLISDNVGGFVDVTVGNGTANNYKGDISFIVEFPTIPISSAQITGMYSAWKAAANGESTTARYRRILRYAGYTGPASLQTGLTTSMGPAATDGQDAVSALEAVVATEGGAHYIARDGTITFKSRSDRYNAFAPLYVFGEREDLGELPYESCETDFDPTHLANAAEVTQESTGQLFYDTDAPSTKAFFKRPITRTINSTNADECQDAASYLISRYRRPATRVSSLVLHPSANPALWPVCLGLELGTRARAVRRPPGVPPVTVEMFVENLEWAWGDDLEAKLTLQGSPADLSPYGIIAAWHTTLATSPAAGVTTVTVRAGQDNTNVLAAQIAPGQQLVLGQGTANQETVTVSAVGTTASGWTTGTLTLTAATTKSHASGDVVCEPLPAGTTDSTTWDSVAGFDAICFAY
ncbi:hypothetical protein ABTX35_28625 [Streptomyces sp. NPDC096080]|uniref:hypothetical protein n=1 Tax=Streptomyces sp. NPDC096080 TaxID=3156693 RepID=UPI00332301A2